MKLPWRRMLWALVVVVPCMVVCVLGLLADLVRWQWLADRCEAWVVEMLNQ